MSDPAAPDHVLLVEDGRFFASLVKNRIESELQAPVIWASSLAEAQEVLEEDATRFFIALCDLGLPDAPDGEVVDHVLARQIPTVVFTGEFGEDKRDRFWKKKVVDYVLKEGPHNIEYIVGLVRRVRKNRGVKILVCDDSAIYRAHIANLLRVHQYQVLEAADGEDALAQVEAHQDVRLILTDYNMPGMNGFQLTNRIRRGFRKGGLAIIGMSAQGSSNVSARFVKNGADDFLYKPFAAEEFYCRVTHNMETLDYIQTIREYSQRDYLTGLYNRRFFFDTARKIFAGAARKHLDLAATMIDIDFFKKVNDTYGHDAGDVVLKEVSYLLDARFRESDILARFGGEEFCVLTPNMNPDQVVPVLDEIRQSVEDLQIKVGETTIQVTVSVGVCPYRLESLELMIEEADKRLYDAKHGGRNRVVASSPPEP